ncbi:unnamed protein product [Rhizophagus irregularis]|uniref:Uncharacterized protein n=1 Tax=Rhizophagus irregularis TaxID=588596 RepID=A0A2N1N9P1_9GLOM|nr:hypothetical protein RhiirC2_849822 [Rhizophagus irregularis]CAB4395285.1 unnamed protein product [Rhizophagus irregularis]CAB5372305.1 unnamed protein product [Rhizophagus irregularis]
MEDIKKIIKRKSLGRTECIGSLYNATRDIFCKTKILKSGVSDDAMRRVDISDTKILCDYKDSYKEKFNKLDIENELRLSILTEITALKNSGTYLRDIRKSFRSVRGTLIYIITTIEEHLEIYRDDVKACISTDEFNNSDATHIVTGIKWGTTMTAIFECKDVNEENRSQIEGALKSRLKKIANYGEGRIDVKDEPYNIMECFIIRLLGDVIPHDKERTQSFDEVIRVISDIPLYIKKFNNGKGFPVEYTLYPLSELTKQLSQNVIVKSIATKFNEETILKIEQVFDGLSESKQRLYDLYHDAKSTSDLIPNKIFDEINNYRQMFREEGSRFKHELAESLVKIRSGKSNTIEFENIIKKFQKGILSKDSIMTYIQQHRSISIKADLVHAIKSEKVKYLDNNSTIKHILNMHSNNHVFILFDNEDYIIDENSSSVYSIFRDLCNLNEGIGKFFIADLKTFTGIKDPGRLVIHHYINGKLNSDDYYNDNKELFTSNLIKFDSEPRFKPKHNPSEKIRLTLPCPQVDCPSLICEWKCLKCKQSIDYGFNLRLYCRCGESKISRCKFKCNSSYHINGYVSFELNELTDLLPSAPSQDETNILLLGETGVGKTTFVNAFANYLKFKTLSDAKSGDIEIFVSSKFTITDENYNNKVIKIGKADSNEQLENVSASSTQECRSYIFHLAKNKRIRLIDTPGIGDTRGIDQDKKNFENILNFISNFKFLNGICILLKPNNSRLNVVFRFYIQELLSNLHKNAKDNIAFCFTNSRGTFYRPGDTLPSLKKQLEEFKKRSTIEIKANKETMYCFDNESFRFLAAIKAGVSFTDTDEQSFSESWDKSADESSRLIKYIMTRPPHKIKHTLSLNNSRNIVTMLSKPLAEIEQLIQINIKLVKEKQKELENFNQITEEFKDKLNILQLKLEPIALEYPRTVCTNSNCIKFLQIKLTNIKTIDYATHCCPSCNLTNIRCDKIDGTALRCCPVLAGKCKVCGCCWDKHIYITYENKINVKVKKKSTKKAIIEKCQKRIIKLQKEQRKINEINFKFAQFLRQNAIYSSCDAYVDYLNHLINEEKSKKSTDDDDEIINGLEITKRNYLKEIEVIKRAIENNDSSMPPILPKDITEFEQQLYNLKINGSTLKRMKDEAERNRTNAFRYNENHYTHTWKSLSNFITKVFHG